MGKSRRGPSLYLINEIYVLRKMLLFALCVLFFLIFFSLPIILLWYLGLHESDSACLHDIFILFGYTHSTKDYYVRISPICHLRRIISYFSVFSASPCQLRTRVRVL